MSGERAKRLEQVQLWLTLFLALQVADALTTFWALQLGAREGAPLYGFLFAHTSFAVATVVKAVAAAILCVWVWLNSRVWPRVAVWEAIGLCAWMVVVVVVVGNNLLIIGEQGSQIGRVMAGA